LKKLLAVFSFLFVVFASAQSFDSGFDWNWWNCEHIASYIAVEDIRVSFTTGRRFEYDLLMSGVAESDEDAVSKVVNFVGAGRFQYRGSFKLRVAGSFDILTVGSGASQETAIVYWDLAAKLLCVMHMYERPDPFSNIMDLG
jgi:uncharacterized protein YggL (DUF469 family)